MPLDSANSSGVIRTSTAMRGGPIPSNDLQSREKTHKESDCSGGKGTSPLCAAGAAW